MTKAQAREMSLQGIIDQHAATIKRMEDVHTNDEIENRICYHNITRSASIAKNLKENWLSKKVSTKFTRITWTPCPEKGLLYR